MNLYLRGASGRKLHETYVAAWDAGLKTTYYLRTISASNAEKSTVAAGSHNSVASEAVPKFCALGDPGCEACQ